MGYVDKLRSSRQREKVSVTSRVDVGNLTVTVPAQAAIKGDVRVTFGRLQIFRTTIVVPPPGSPATLMGRTEPAGRRILHRLAMAHASGPATARGQGCG